MAGFVDPYFDETIRTLRNLLGAKSDEELKELEAQIVFANELELPELNLMGSLVSGRVLWSWTFFVLETLDPSGYLHFFYS